MRKIKRGKEGDKDIREDRRKRKRENVSGLS